MGSIYVLKLFTEASATKLFVATYDVQNPFYVVDGAGPVVIVFQFYLHNSSSNSA